jgi:hypothetical protein
MTLKERVLAKISAQDTDEAKAEAAIEAIFDWLDEESAEQFHKYARTQALGEESAVDK